MRRCAASSIAKTLVGVSALIYQDGHEAYFGAFGQADREAGKPMTRDTLVQIFSMTKPITGVALMSLYEAGKFQLDDPLAKYAPGVRPSAGVRRKGCARQGSLRSTAPARDHSRSHAPYGGVLWGHGPLAGRGYVSRRRSHRQNPYAGGKRRKCSARCRCCFSRDPAGYTARRSMCRRYLVERLSGMPFDEYPAAKNIQALKDEAHALRLAAGGQGAHGSDVRLARGRLAVARSRRGRARVQLLAIGR